MQLNQIFEKPVDRPIEGVIKADDQASLAVEVDEYILTHELQKRLEAFLNSYNHYDGANGTWISGFFGSGKSHLLKMLAYLLESKTPDSQHILESFLKKCGDNELLRAEIIKAVAIPSKSILFNIDQKADVISKRDVDALLGVFVKVFNEMQGYFGKQGHIAQFERELDERGVYAQFRDEFERISGLSWHIGREQSILEGENIAAAYASVMDSSLATADGILDKYEASYRVSIEDFADMVNTYLKRQEANSRLNFFVDEVGQYIADNIKLMTNLQTIAETLATKCRGRAWIIVTAQEEIDSITGEMGARQGNDFSKIQDRFKTRMKLTSQDVAEVIQKRLLAKNKAGVTALSRLYGEQVNNFKTLFDFTDGVPPYRNYKDQDHFINAYPFIPYQFVLFQTAIQSLSQHNAFEGKHSSVGERSMLGVFQQVAMKIGDHQIGQLATFDLMFEGIRSSLKANTQRSIFNAEVQLDDPFAKRLLKTLFLVKYVKEFKASERNLTVLMTDRFGQDISALRKQIETALNELEQRTYIQRNGIEYEYLTDEEKDVEQEIKNTPIDTASIIDELGTIVFDRIIKETKIRAEQGLFDYGFSRMLDGRPFKGKTHELTIHLVTPFNEHVGHLATLLSQSMGRDELVIVMPDDGRIMPDLKLYMQTQKYFNQNINKAPSERIKSILNNKQYLNNDRYNEIVQKARELIAAGTFISNGAELVISGEDVQTKVFRGFHQLIRSTYTHLKMLPQDSVYREGEVGKYLSNSDSLFSNDTLEMPEAERELLSSISLQKNTGTRITLKGLTEKFERKPYGWYLAAILITLAKIHARGRVEIRQDGMVLEGKELEAALLNTRLHPNLVLTPEEDYSASQIRTLKDFYNDFFDAPPLSEEAKDLANQTKAELLKRIISLTAHAQNSRNYPFLKALEPVIDQLKAVTNKSYSWYLTEFTDDADRLLNMKDDTIAPILNFMNGGQREIYDEAQDFLKVQHANFQSIGYDESIQIEQILADPACYRGDYMRRVKALMDGLRTTIDGALTDAKTTAYQLLTAQRQRLEGDERFKRLSVIQQQNLIGSFQDITGRVTKQYTVISVIEREVARFQTETFTRLLTLMDEWLHQNRAASPVARDSAAPAVAKYVRLRDIEIDFDKLSLDNEADLDAYLDALAEAYRQHIRDGKRIQL